MFYYIRNIVDKDMAAFDCPPTLVMSLVNEHVRINSGDLNNRKKWSKQFKEYQANLVQARRAVVEFEKVAFPNVKCLVKVAEDFQPKLNLLYIMVTVGSHHINENTNSQLIHWKLFLNL